MLCPGHRSPRQTSWLDFGEWKGMEKGKGEGKENGMRKEKRENKKGREREECCAVAIFP